MASDDTAHDSHLTRIIGAVTRDVERHTRRALITQTWQLKLREFRATRRILLPRPPLASIGSIVYFNDSGVSTTLSSALYQVATGSTPGFVEPAYGQDWPSTRAETAEAITITYTCGYGDEPDDIPEEFQNVIIELSVFRFTSRGDVDAAIPKHIKWALDSLKCGTKFEYYDLKD